MSKIVQNALRALLYEVVTWPKPGLVDSVSQGPHPDMNVYLFIDSSVSLTDYFKEAEKIGRQFSDVDLTGMFRELRQAGIKAEKTMFTATHGINTHKGAIFSLGLFTCAVSYCQKHGLADEFAVVKRMTCGLVAHDLGKKSNTAGERQFLRYGLGGVRAEAEAGYPIIRDVALPFLTKSSGSLQTRLLDTLMKIASVSVDSNLIKRAGSLQVITWLHEQAKEYLQLGGFVTKEGKHFLQHLNEVCLNHNYSLGGCADLLIVTIFLGLEEGVV